jgi:hypothetical protein
MDRHSQRNVNRWNGISPSDHGGMTELEMLEDSNKIWQDVAAEVCRVAGADALAFVPARIRKLQDDNARMRRVLEEIQRCYGPWSLARSLARKGLGGDANDVTTDQRPSS